MELEPSVEERPSVARQDQRRLSLLREHGLQGPAQVGRKDTVIPDYVVYPSKTNKRGYESCKMVLEAKYIISSENDLINSRGQLISYARRLNAPIAILASNSQVFVYQSHDDYDDVIQSWNDLQNNDEVVKLKKIIWKNL